MARRRRKQLFSRLSEGAALPRHIDLSGNVVARDAQDLPFVYWPDGYPCFEANAYMLMHWRQGKSLRNRGGTIAEYAKNISPLLRFCHDNDLSLLSLNDNLFQEFINTLQSRNEFGEYARSANEVLKIGRRCIDFLECVGTLHSDAHFLGEKECNINATKKRFKVRSNKGKDVHQTYWHHDCFPTPDPVKKKSPIGLEVVKTLKDEANKTSDRGLRLRKLLLIASLEQTGGRRYELSYLRVEDVEKASQEEGIAPLLRMLTVKDGKPRDVPVSKAYIQQAMWYIKRVRSQIIRKTIGKTKDHGYVFINHQTGKKLAVDTLTTELNELCVSANINTKRGHAHLFRHGYITQKIKAMILLYDIANKDEFRKALLNFEAFKQELQQWTGHKSVDSLDTYIDLAFNELSNMEKVFDVIALGAAVGVVFDRLDVLQADAESGELTTSQLLEEFKELLTAFKDDVERSQKELSTSDDLCIDKTHRKHAKT